MGFGPDTDDLADAAIDDYLRRVDAGEDVDQDAFLAAHPEVAPALRSFFMNEVLFRRMLTNGPTASLVENPPAADPRAFAAAIGSARQLPWSKLPAQLGRYRVEKLIGRGAMGTVYRAHDTQLDRPVALKIPHVPADASTSYRQRLLQEARAAAVLGHPHICRVYDVGEIDGRDFIAMELIEGKPLSDYIRGGKLPSLRSAALTVRKLAQALQSAHQQGVIHRDLKPGNVMVRRDGEPVLMDFGLAQRPATMGEERLTQDGTMIGSPAYMAPEQARVDGQAIGPTTDIYGLGVVFFELLTGRLPFTGSVLSILAKVLSEEPPSIPLLRPDCDRELARICKRMLAKAPEQRFGSMQEVAEALQAWLKATRNSQAIPDAESPAAPQTEITAEELASLVVAAKRCLRQHDYGMAAQLLGKVPSRQHTDESARLLQSAQDLQTEVDLLTTEMDHALSAGEFDTLRATLQRLLELKPGHARARELLERLNSYGEDAPQYRFAPDGELLPAGTPEGIFNGFGRKLGLATLVGLVVFAAVSWVAWNELSNGQKKPGQLTVAAPRLPVPDIPQLPQMPAAASSPSTPNPPAASQSTSPAAVPNEPRIEAVSELSFATTVKSLWVSPDATRIYFEWNNSIWLSERGTDDAVTVAERFRQPQSLFPGRFVSLSADERSIVVVVNGQLCSSWRASLDQPFRTPEPMAELQSFQDVKCPSLTADGLGLVFFEFTPPQPKRFYMARRPSVISAWSTPQELQIKFFDDVQPLSWPQLLNDRRTLLCNDESSTGDHRFVLLEWHAASNSYEQPWYLGATKLSGLMGRCPRYVAATDELYFLSPRSRRIERNADGTIVDDWTIFRLTSATQTLGDSTTSKLRGDISAAVPPLSTASVNLVPNVVPARPTPQPSPRSGSSLRADLPIRNSYTNKVIKPYTGNRKFVPVYLVIHTGEEWSFLTHKFSALEEAQKRWHEKLMIFEHGFGYAQQQPGTQRLRLFVDVAEGRYLVMFGTPADRSFVPDNRLDVWAFPSKQPGTTTFHRMVHKQKPELQQFMPAGYSVSAVGKKAYAGWDDRGPRVLTYERPK
jgi:serine/threonine protein kinase